MLVVRSSRAQRVPSWVTGLLLALAATGCGPADPSVPVADEERSPATGVSDSGGPDAAPTSPLTDVGAQVGIDFTHLAGNDGGFTYPEPLGAGVALFDADDDGDLDLYAVQGGHVPGTEYGTVASNRLYRQEADGTFTDVTEEAGVGDEGYGTGAAAADYDGDGDQDLFVTNVGRDVLYRNEGDGTFTDVTVDAGLADDESYSLSAAFADLDRDGDLDLYVTNYVIWYPGADPACVTPAGVRDYCGPSKYRPGRDRLYRNDGDGSFTDVSETSGVAGIARRSMGVICADFTGDRWPDVFVTNDGEDNTLWVSRGDGTLAFTDEAALRGCAVNMDGVAEASMGVACEDLDGDGDLDLYVTHLRRETNTLYRNDGGYFSDVTAAAGLARWNHADTGFGVGFFDLENDGHLDLFVANGGVELETRPLRPEEPYAQRNRLIAGEAEGRFRDVTAEAGPALELVEMSRAVAFGDIDRDGRVDLAVSNNRGPLRLFRNTASESGHWIAIRLRGVRDNRDGLGAWVTLERGTGGRTRLVYPFASYLATSDPGVHFGLGDDDAPCDVVVTWPRGGCERFAGLDVDRWHLLRQGEGEALDE